MTGETLIAVLGRGVVLLAIAAGGAVALRRAPAAHRHLVWTLGAAALLLLPVAARVLPAVDVRVLPAAPAADRAPTPAEAVADAAPTSIDRPAPEVFVPAAPPDTRAAETAADVPAPAEPSAPAAAPARPSPGVPWLLLAWIAGAAVSLFSLPVGAFAVRRLLRRSEPPADRRLLAAVRAAADRLGLRRPPRVRVTDDLSAPVTVGALRPTVLLPRTALAWPDDRLDPALRHELAHVRRRDLLAELAARIAAAIHWPNPFAWLALRRLRIERERACDDLVLATGSRAEEYAGFLVSLARSLRSAPLGAAVAATMAGGSRFERRVRAILDGRARRGAPGRGGGLVFGAAAALLLVAVAAANFVPAIATAADGTTIVVKADGSGDYRTIAAAVAAAPEGATVRVGPGNYVESITLRKAVVLEGAGADRTTVTAPNPVISAESGRGIVLRGLTLTGEAGGPAVVIVRDAAVALEKVAVVGSPGSGVLADQGADVAVRGCLVADVEQAGVDVAAAGERPPAVRVEGSDLRNCRYAGVRIGAGNENVAVERCRISGASWHGIRYDSAAPVVRGNLIFGNARSGIYASGDTEGRIEGNLFYRNGQGEISLWYRAKDRVEGNSFVESPGTGVAILGASDPAVRKNVFSGCRIGVRGGSIGGGGEAAEYAGGGTVEGNFFWKNGSDFQVPGEKEMADTELPDGNVVADPGFADPAERDYSLAKDSAARKAGAGVAEPLSFESPWPVRDAEKATAPAKMAPAGPAAAKQPTPQQAYAMAKPWVEDALQIRDPAKRDAAIEEIRKALTSGDPLREYAGLLAFTQSAKANFDKAAFRDLILPLAKKVDGPAQVSAFYALYNTGMKDGDLGLLLDVTADPGPAMKNSLSHLIFLYSKGEVTGPAGERVLALLGSDARDEVREALRGIWGAKVSPEVEAKVLALSKDPTTKHDAIYFGLSTFREKSKAVIERLVDVLGDADPNDWQRALWGLGHGIPKENERLVADAMMMLIKARSDDYTRTEALRSLARYGDTSHLADLQAVADNPMASEAVRAAAKRAIEAIERR